MKISEHFVAQEFLPRATFNAIMKTEDPLKEFFKLVNPKIIAVAEFYRNFFGVPIIVNNWHSGGTYEYRGWRPKNCKVGAKKSQHKLGNAFDCDVKGKSAESVRTIILKNKGLFYANGVRRLENGVTWVHTDIKEGLTLTTFNP